MNKELIIRSGSDAVDFALLKDGKLIELHKEEEKQSNFAVGDIFIAKIRKPVAGLNAAFVNLGYEKDAFLHYHDLGPNLPSMMKFIKLVSAGKIKDYSLKNFPFEPEINKDGAITDILSPNQSILVQVVKEPISTKGPRISSEISLAGRYVVLVPFSDRISVSQKIESKEEKDRLKRLVQSIRPKGFGVIVRTVAEGKKVAELDKDLQTLIERWSSMSRRLQTAQHPSKVLGELNKASSILRDVFNDTFTCINVDDEDLYLETKEYLQEIAPDKVSIVKHYQSKDLPLFEKYHIERQIKTSFGKTVSMSKGAYLIIEHTEALHVIDVNSGIRAKSGADQEHNAFDVNMNAAEEIARQLRLRDMGGIIIVDFIDMESNENKIKLFKHMQTLMQGDRAKHNILPVTKFGLMQITRQRVRPTMEINTTESCPSCNGSGKISSSLLIDETIERQLAYYVREKGRKSFTIKVNPILGAYLTKGIASIRFKLAMKYKCTLKVKESSDNQMLQVIWHDAKGEKIEE